MSCAAVPPSILSCLCSLSHERSDPIDPELVASISLGTRSFRETRCRRAAAARATGTAPNVPERHGHRRGVPSSARYVVVLSEMEGRSGGCTMDLLRKTSGAVVFRRLPLLCRKRLLSVRCLLDWLGVKRLAVSTITIHSLGHRRFFQFTIGLCSSGRRWRRAGLQPAVAAMKLQLSAREGRRCVTPCSPAPPPLPPR